MSCKHHIDGECRHSLALPLYGARPSAGVCGVCEHYDGPARGLGDVIAMATAVTGIDRALKAVVGTNCGCAERQQMLNEKIPFK